MALKHTDTRTLTYTKEDVTKIYGHKWNEKYRFFFIDFDEIVSLYSLSELLLSLK